MKKVVVLNSEFRDLKYEEKVLMEVDDILLQKVNVDSSEEIIKYTHDAFGIMIQHGELNEKIIDSLTNCKVISRYGVGIEKVNLEKAHEKGIIVSNVPDYGMDEVSDHALALIMCCARKILLLNENVQQGIWNVNKSCSMFRIKNQTVGIIGFGNISKELVKKLIAIGFKVFVYDPYIDEETVINYKAKFVSLDYIFKNSDFISIHVPLTGETKGMINMDLFKLSKKNLIVINTSRGSVINESDLIEALRSGQILGAALDVIEEEPITSKNPLLTMKNVIITPHVAWYSEESQRELREKCARNVVEVAKGNNPPFIVS